MVDHRAMNARGGWSCRWKTGLKCLPLLLALFPFIAHADERLTYRCDGTQIDEAFASTGPRSVEHITRLYTLYLEGGGHWYDWDEHRWYPIDSITHQAFRLAFSSSHGVSWTFSIDRKHGTWNQLWTGNGGRTVDTGKCTLVKLRIPPGPPPARLRAGK